MDKRDIENQAAAWIARLDGKAASDFPSDFVAWLENSPHHRASFVRLEVAWRRVNPLREFRPPIDGAVDVDLLAPSAPPDGLWACSSAYGLSTKPSVYGLGLRAQFSTAARPPRIVRPPGTWAVRILGAVLTRRAFRRRVLVCVTEMRGEYYDALLAGHRWLARWVVVRGHFLMIWPWLCALCPRVVRKLF